MIFNRSILGRFILVQQTGKTIRVKRLPIYRIRENGSDKPVFPTSFGTAKSIIDYCRYKPTIFVYQPCMFKGVFPAVYSLQSKNLLNKQKINVKDY